MRGMRVNEVNSFVDVSSDSDPLSGSIGQEQEKEGEDADGRRAQIDCVW